MKKYLGVLWVLGTSLFIFGAAIAVCAVGVPVQPLRFQAGMAGAGICLVGWALVLLVQRLED